MNVAALTGAPGRLPTVAQSNGSSTAAPAAQEKPQEQEPYLSPVFRFDKQARVLVFQFRDSETGNVTRQYPSEKVVKLYRDNAPQPTPAAQPSEFHAAEEPSKGGEPAEATSAPEPTTGTSAGSSTEASSDRVELTA